MLLPALCCTVAAGDIVVLVAIVADPNPYPNTHPNPYPNTHPDPNPNPNDNPDHNHDVIPNLNPLIASPQAML